MLLVLFIGYILVNILVMCSIFNKFVILVNILVKVIIFVMFVFLLVSWLNWGFGLVIGVLFVKVIVK